MSQQCPAFLDSRPRDTLQLISSSFINPTLNKMKAIIVGSLLVAAVAATPMPAPTPVSPSETSTSALGCATPLT